MMMLHTSIRNPATPRSNQKAEDGVEGGADLVVPPVEIGLLGQMVVEVVLTGGRIERPGRAAEAAHPVVGRAAVGSGIGPDVPVALAGDPRRAGVDEPRVLVAGVVGDEVQKDPYAPLAGLGHQEVEVGHRPQIGLDGAEVGHVVAPVGVGRHGDRAQPDPVDAQPLEMVEVVDDPPDVPGAVGVRVGERAGIDLIEDGGPPPRERRRRSSHLWATVASCFMTTQHVTSGPRGFMGVWHWLDGGQVGVEP